MILIIIILINFSSYLMFKMYLIILNLTVEKYLNNLNDKKLQKRMIKKEKKQMENLLLNFIKNK